MKSKKTVVLELYPPIEERSEMIVAAEGIIIYGSTSVDQPNKKRE